MLPESASSVSRLFFVCLLYKSTAQGDDDSRRCYVVGNETVCYFKPTNTIEMNWDDASKFCRDYNATLPVILNSNHQRTIEEYLHQFSQNKSIVFNAGRKSWSIDPHYPWRWVNGKQCRTPVHIVSEDYIFGCIYAYTDATSLVPNGVYSCSVYPSSFVCQYSEGICKTLNTSKYQLDDRSHCFVIYNKRLSWYEARNKCIEGGGDLASFEDIDTFVSYRNFTSDMKKHHKIFIGLQKSWWTWRAKESFDIKYTNWPERVFEPRMSTYASDDVSGLDCLCLNGSNNFKWMSCNCSEGRSFLCQSVTSHDERLQAESKTDKFSNVSRCYDVSGTRVCYFTPENVTRLNFASASQWCTDNNATLPIIRNKAYQQTLESFLETTALPFYLLWTSGIKVSTGGWRWINGHPFREPDINDHPQFMSVHLSTRHQYQFDRKGQLLRYISYSKTPQLKNNGYVCQFPGDSCKIFSNGLRNKNGECLVVNEEHVSWYEARNRCIDKGGDLATFEDVSAVEKLSPLLSLDKSYHIGLENSRWIWYQSDKLEDCIQYTNWIGSFSGYLEDECDMEWVYCCIPVGPSWSDFRRDISPSCMCLQTFAYTWMPCDCDLNFRFVCQRVCSDESDNHRTIARGLRNLTTCSQKVSSILHASSNSIKKMCPSEVNQGMIIAVVEGVIIAALVISLTVLFRKRSKTVVNSALEMQIKPEAGYISFNPTPESNPSEYQDLKLYEEVR